MRASMLIAALSATLLCAGMAKADQITAPVGDLGPTYTFNVGGVSVTAYAFSGPMSATNLYFKNLGGEDIETGLGLARNRYHEISSGQFVSLDVSNLNSASISLWLGSVERGESYSIWGSNTLGQPGTELTTGDLNGQAVTVADDGMYKYISVSAPTGNVTVWGIADPSGPVATPEPGTLTMLVAGIALAAGLAFVTRNGKPRLG